MEFFFDFLPAVSSKSHSTYWFVSSAWHWSAWMNDKNGTGEGGELGSKNSQKTRYVGCGQNTPAFTTYMIMSQNKSCQH